MALQFISREAAKFLGINAGNHPCAEWKDERRMKQASTKIPAASRKRRLEFREFKVRDLHIWRAQEWNGGQRLGLNGNSYTIMLSDGRWTLMLSDGQEARPIGVFESADAAKVAAQGDYEANFK